MNNTRLMLILAGVILLMAAVEIAKGSEVEFPGVFSIHFSQSAKPDDEGERQPVPKWVEFRWRPEPKTLEEAMNVDGWPWEYAGAVEPVPEPLCFFATTVVRDKGYMSHRLLFEDGRVTRWSNTMPVPEPDGSMIGLLALTVLGRRRK